MPKICADTTILRNQQIADGVYELLLAAPSLAALAQPGQFVHIDLKNDVTLLRRPLSLSFIDKEKGQLRIVYRIVGKGTAYLAVLKSGDVINCLGPLGHGFDLNCQNALLVGGGMGIAPLRAVAAALGSEHASILMGGRTQAELFWQPMYAGLVKQMFITTDDGSLGVKGFTVDLLPKLLQTGSYDRMIVCGPEIMMQRAAEIAARYQVPCQVSLEKHMACGLGACLSCTCESRNGGSRKKVCKDGPVFWAEEVF